MSIYWLAPLALALDLCFADPKRLPHPVRGIGFLADRLERAARLCGRGGRLVAAGALALLLLLLVTGSVVLVCVSLPWGLGECFALYFAWSGLALGGLIREGRSALASVARARKDDAALPEARLAVRMLVSRDTDRMDCDDLCRSLCESLSENLNDAFVAPLFWLLLGGPPGLWLYKCASTMDSMWGYTNERWLLWGRASARLDDALAYIPARLTVVVLLMTAWLAAKRSGKGLRLSGCPGWPGWRVVAGQARRSASPNAGWPMAAAAWLFDGKTGGPTPYHGEIVMKPFMGPEEGRWTEENAAALLGLMPWIGVPACALGVGGVWLGGVAAILILEKV